MNEQEAKAKLIAERANKYLWLDIFDEKFLDAQEEQVLIEDFLSRGDLMLFAGPSKAGKLMAMIWMIQSMIYSRPFLGGDVAPPVPILYCDYEMKRNYVRNWYERMLGGADVEPTRKYFKYRCKNGIDGSVGKLPLYMTPEWLADQAAEVEKQSGQKGVIIIDTLRGAFGMMEHKDPNWENSAGGVGKILRPIQDWCHASGWAVIILHHMNKSATVSGSTDLQAACDHVCEFWRDLSSNSHVSEWSLHGRFNKAIPKRVATFKETGFTYQGTAEQWALRKQDFEARNNLMTAANEVVGRMTMAATYSANEIDNMTSGGRDFRLKVRRDVLKSVLKVTPGPGNSELYQREEDSLNHLLRLS